MNKTLITSAGIALIVGIVLGYGIRYSQPQPVVNGHRMPDGSMMSTEMGNMTAGLLGKYGASFDEAFLQEMIVHHEGAVEMANMVLARSERAELKQLANDIINAQRKEIEMMRGWKREWFGE